MAFNHKKPTALFVGRYQPFHEGHKKLIEEGLKRVGQVCIGVRDTFGDDDNPYTFQEVKESIMTGLAAYRGKFVIFKMPNITNVFYGRDVGYNVEQISLDADIEAISARAIRAKMKK